MLPIDNVLLFDGGFGSEIEKYKLSHIDSCDINMLYPEVIRKIHESYSSSDIMTTNTFNLNRIKYKGNYSIEEIALQAISLAKIPGKKVFFDLGPTGSMLKPIGLLTFDEAYECYKELVLIARDHVDGFICETFSDIYELKACVLAVKENSDLPIFATMTFTDNGRTLTGTTPSIMALILEGLGVDAFGVNCSLGPSELLPIVEELLANSNTPIIVQPNRGMPKMNNGETYYDLSIEEFDHYMKLFVDMGVAVIGGCCGTNPEFIDKLSEYKGREVVKRKVEKTHKIASSTKLVSIDNVVICGERLNPTGKKKLKEAILNDDYDYLVREAIKQEENGCDLLDLNLGVAKIDEAAKMKKAIEAITEYTTLPLQVDSSNANAIEVGCRYFNGIAIINSVNGNYDVMDKIFPIAKKYGAIVLGLTLDDDGIPKTYEKRVEIAKRIIDYAAKYGISKDKIMIDTLTLTASCEQELAFETLNAIKEVRKLGVKCALGVSNVSFGLPNRGLLNKTFLTMALTVGLNMPILNPMDKDMIDAINAYKVLANVDNSLNEYIDKYKEFKKEVVEVKATTNTLYDLIVKGLKNDISNKVLELLNTKLPMDIINEDIIPALGYVGELFNNKTIFLPQLISSAEASKEAFRILQDKIEKKDSKGETILLCTVYGDIHDIGKNICKVVLESYGFNVIDLGKDTKIEVVLEGIKKYNPFAIGLSALMTTTVINMENTIKAVKKEFPNVKIFVGGAVLSNDIAKQINADYYTKDALEFANVLSSITK